MRGKTTCHFLGGPQGDVDMEFAAIECRDTIGLLLTGWLTLGPDGSAIVMAGMPDLSADWLSYHVAVYQKDRPVKEGGINYTYRESRAITRCEHFLEKARRRCRNEAVPGGVYCNRHASRK